MENEQDTRELCTNQFKTYFLKKYPLFPRKCTALNTIVNEVPIDRKVLRVLLPKTVLTQKFNNNNLKTSKKSQYANCLRKASLRRSKNIPDPEKRNFMNVMDLKEKINHKFQTIDHTKHKSEPEVFDYENFELTPVHIIHKRKLPVYSQTSYFYLNMPKVTEPQEGSLNYDFNKLIKDVKTMRLPAPEWRIKIMVKKKAITGIVFTDKKELERCVTFSLKSTNYKIMINNKPVLLMGAPLTINSISELEVLLDIVANIQCEDQMLLYK